MLIEQDGFAQVGRHRFLKTAKNNFWEDAEEDLWDSWIWQQSNRVKTLNTCEKVLNMTDDERKALRSSSVILSTFSQVFRVLTRLLCCQIQESHRSSSASSQKLFLAVFKNRWRPTWANPSCSMSIIGPSHPSTSL